MSILIKGMEMPESCAKCNFGDGYSCYATGYIVQDYDWENKRADFCPLVEVPPHGRLIDADALIERMFDQLVAKTMMFGGQYVYTKEEIDNAPTIIPSDKDGEA